MSTGTTHHKIVLLPYKSNMKRLRILFLSHRFSPDIGGIEVHSEVLANSFAQAGHEVRLVTWTPTVGAKNFTFAVVRNPGMFQLIKEHRWADVVFENNPSVRLAWPQVFFRRPLVIALHTWIARTNGTVSLLDKLKTRRLANANKVIACSKAVRLRCWPDAAVIENPYQENLFRILPAISRQKEFVFLGRLVSDKGADLAIHAIHKFIAAEEERGLWSNRVSLTIIGEGPEKENLEKLVRRLNLEHNVTFKGALRVDKLVECLNEHRFILVPSVWEEPFGMVALEGMACGCVPIVSDGGGLPDAIGEAGLTFRRGNVDSFVDAIRTVFGNEELEKKLKEAATDHLSLHRQEPISKRYLNIIEEVV